jgi:hypothetical protein
MPGPAHVKTVISGTYPNGEIFAFGYSTLGEAGNQATLNTTAAAVAAVFTTTGTTQTLFKGLINNQSAYTKVTCYSYAAGASNASLTAQVTMNVVGAGAGSLPLQMCLVATLRTAVPSRRARGRMYLPANGISNIDNKGYLSTPTPQAIADAVAVLIVAQGSAIKAVVISVVGNSAEQITKVTVDNKFDVQRRRANKQLATTVGTATV